VAGRMEVRKVGYYVLVERSTRQGEEEADFRRWRWRWMRAGKNGFVPSHA
jgi:hypothetical protein